MTFERESDHIRLEFRLLIGSCLFGESCLLTRKKNEHSAALIIQFCSEMYEPSFSFALRLGKFVLCFWTVSIRHCVRAFEKLCQKMGILYFDVGIFLQKLRQSLSKKIVLKSKKCISWEMMKSLKNLRSLKRLAFYLQKFRRAVILRQCHQRIFSFLKLLVFLIIFLLMKKHLSTF